MDSEQWDFRRNYRILGTIQIHLYGLNALDAQISAEYIRYKYRILIG